MSLENSPSLETLVFLDPLLRSPVFRRLYGDITCFPVGQRQGTLLFPGMTLWVFVPFFDDIRW